jgi:hypothetical protein
MAFDYCNAPLTPHELIACGNWKKGSINALAIIEDATLLVDYESAADWNAAIAAGDVKIIKQIKGELPEPSVIEGSNPVGGGRENITDGYNYTLEVQDYNVSAANDTFYENLNPRIAAIAYFMPKTGEIGVVLQEVTFNARPIVPMSSTEKQHYLLTSNWDAPANEFPLRFTAPTGIFTV